MDRREAIEYIQEWLKDKYALNGKDRAVLNMAIESLMLRDKYVKALERMIEGAKEINKFLEEAAKKSDEKLQLSGETSTCKLKKDHDFLIKPDSDECKEQKSKLDCISRTDAIAYIDRILNSGLGKNKSLDYIRKYISALPPVMPDYETFCGVPIKEAIEVLEKYKHSPSVTPTERTGKWAVAYLDHESVGVRPRTLYCSECNWLTSFPSAWCPNCGAKMKGGTENG